MLRTYNNINYITDNNENNYKKISIEEVYFMIKLFDIKKNY